ncbi:MAG: Hpt domain-containing protein [Phycisphaerales bacterium]
MPSLRSRFADDPEMGELVELFLTELPERARAIRAAAYIADREGIGRLAHKLKGAAGGYGFPTIGEAAARLELLAGRTRSIEITTEEVRDLIDLCQRASGGRANGSA